MNVLRFVGSVLLSGALKSVPIIPHFHLLVGSTSHLTDDASTSSIKQLNFQLLPLPTG